MGNVMMWDRLQEGKNRDHEGGKGGTACDGRGEERTGDKRDGEQE